MLLIYLLFQTALSQSEHVQSVTACWILAYNDNMKSRNLNHLIENIATSTKIKDPEFHLKGLQVYMVKKCFAVIKKEDVQQILTDFENGNKTHTTYRELVKGFDYGQYYKEIRKPTEIKNEALDSTILAIIKMLEKEFAQIPIEPSEQFENIAQTNYLPILSIIFLVVLFVIIYRLVKKGDNQNKKKQ